MSQFRKSEHELGSMALCRRLGITHRQLHWATRHAGFVDLEPHRGTGRRMVWRPDEIRRMEVAVSLAKAIPRTTRGINRSILPAAVDAVFRGPPPPDEGWALLATDGALIYSEELAFDLASDEIGGVVARIEDLWPLDEPEGEEEVPEHVRQLIDTGQRAVPGEHTDWEAIRRLRYVEEKE